MMQIDSTTKNGARAPFSHTATASKPDAAQKLGQVRNCVRVALRAAEEGPLTVSTADDIARTLTAAMRELEALQLTVAVMERKAR